MKKILATILALVLALGLTATVWAEGDGTASGNMTGADFLAKAKDGVITLTNNVSLSTSCSISDGQTYTINLNRYTLSAENLVIMLRHGKLIVNGAGTIKENDPCWAAIMIKGSETSTDTNYSVLEVNKDVVLEGWAPIFVDQLSSKQNKPFAYGVSVTVNGATLNARKDDPDGGSGVYVNGSITHAENAPVISLTDTTICDIDNASEGMYLAGYAKTTLTNCTITGTTGVEIRAGELTVNGGTITGTATPIGEVPNGNGSTVTGAGIAVSQHTTMLPLTVTVNGGNVEGYSAFYQVDTLAEMKNDAGSKKFTEEQVAAAVAKITLNVNEGVYTANGEDGQAVYSENKTGFVSAGIFSSDVASYLTNDAVAATVVNGDSTDYAVGSTAISAAITSNSTVTVTKGSIDLNNVPAGVIVNNTGDGKVTVNGTKEVKKGDAPYTVPAKTGGYYYYPSTPGITAELNGTNKSATDYPGGDYGLVFRSTAAFSTFQGVQVDGKTLAKSNYTAEEGSTVVYLKAAYLKTLAAGKHTVTILSTSGNTSMDFTVGGKTTAPQTFDAGVGIYAVTAVLSVTGMAWTAKKRH